MQKELRLDKVYASDEGKKLFEGQMNMRFTIIRELMDSLPPEISSQNKEVSAKALFCAFTLIQHLDNFVAEMQEVINEVMEIENATII